MAVKQLCEIAVLQFTNDGSVWGSTFTAHELQRVDELCGQCAMLMRGSRAPKRGELCLVERNTGQWCRAEVKRLLSSMSRGTIAELFLIDRAQWISRPISKCLFLADYSIGPPLAQLFSLAGGLHPQQVSSCNDLTWSDKVLASITKVGAASTKNDWGVRLLMGEEEDGVTLYHKTTTNDLVNLNRYLVDSGLYSLKQKQPFNHTLPVYTQSSKDPFMSSPTQQLLGPQVIEGAPNSYWHVFVEARSVLPPVCQLTMTSFPSFVCKSLEERGFQQPTPVQAHSWPYVTECRDVVIISPHKTGKTLAYLLPLINTVINENSSGHEPSLLILVSTGVKAQLIANQASLLLSWISAAKRFSCSAVYCGVESTSVHQLFNGVDVVVATPPALLRLLKKGLVLLNKLSHLVLDDCELLLDRHLSEVSMVVQLYSALEVKRRKKCLPPQHHLVLVAAEYTGIFHEAVCRWISEPVMVVNSTTDLMLIKKLQLRVLHTPVDQVFSTALSLLVQMNDPVLVCAGDRKATALLLGKLQLHAVSAERWSSRAALPACNIIVVCDDDLKDLLPSPPHQYTLLLHCTLPTDKALFSGRVALLHPVIAIGQNCRMLLITSDANVEQSKGLVQMLERVRVKCPPSLKALVFERNKRQLNSSILVELCLQVKTIGECRLGSQCKQIHSLPPLLSMSKKMASHTLPRDGIVKVKVVSVCSPSQLWVTLLQHIPLRRGDQPSSHDCSRIVATKLGMDLALYYGQPEHQCVHVKPALGDYCALLDGSGCYHRVKVLEFSQPLGLYFHCSEKARVRLVDNGLVTVVDVNQLLTLPEQFLIVPPLVVEVIVCGLQPMDRDIYWSPKATQLAHQHFYEKTLTGRVALSIDQTLWLDPVEERIVLSSVGISTALSTPQQCIVSAGVGIQNPTHLMSLQQNLSIDKPLTHPKLADMQQVTLPHGTSSAVVVSAVAPPTTSQDTHLECYVQLDSAYQNLCELEDQLNNIEYDVPLLASMCPYKLVQGDMCVAKYSIDHKWYRASVVELRGDGELECFFVDYGDSDVVSLDCVQPINQQLCELPVQAMLVALIKNSQCQTDPIPGEHQFLLESTQLCTAQQLWEVTRGLVLAAKVLDVTSEQQGIVVQLKTDEGTDLLNILNNKIEEEEDEEERTDKLSSVISQVISSTSTQQSTDRSYQLLSTVLTCFKRVNNKVLQKLTLFLLSPMAVECCALLLRSLCLIALLNKQACVSLARDEQFSQVMLYLLQTREQHNLLMTVNLLQVIAVQDCLVTEEVIWWLLHHATESTHLKVASNCLDTLLLLLKDSLLCAKVLKEQVCSLVERAKQQPMLVMTTIRMVCVLTVQCPGRYEYLATQLLSFCTNNELHQTVLMILHGESQAIPLPTPPQTIPIPTPPQVIPMPTSPHAIHLPIPPQAIPDGEIVSPSVSAPVKRLKCTPHVLWSQAHSQVTLCVQIRGCHNSNISTTPTSVEFNGTAHDNHYMFHIDLFGEIMPQKCSVKSMGGEVIVKLLKAHRAFWPQLVSKKSKLPFLAVDYSRWREESSCSSSEEEKEEVAPALTREEKKFAKAGGVESSPSPSTDPSDISSGEEVGDWLD